MLTPEEARQRLDETRHRNAAFEEKAREALELGEQYLGVDNAHLARIDTGAGHWEVTASTDPQGAQFPEGLELDLQTTYCRRTIQTDGQMALHDAPAQGWGDDPAFEAHGLHCYHGATLYVDGEPYGTLCFVAEDPRNEGFETDETMLADLIRRLLEQELEQQRYRTELTRRTNLVNVLNRVLRHNMRNEMNVIRGRTQVMADRLEDSASANTALGKIDGLIELCNKARDVEEIVGRNDDPAEANLGPLVRSAVTDISAEFPAASISLDVDANATADVLPTFERGVRELVENAAKHGGESPSVTVTVEHSPRAIEVRVGDTGPGLSDVEREVLKSGVETPLVHGSGLGLWLVHWIATNHGGSVEATVTDTGTVVTLSIPRESAGDSGQNLAELKRARDRYQVAFDEAFDAHLLFDDQSRIIEANPAAAGIYGVERKELRGRLLTEFTPENPDASDDWNLSQDGETDHSVLTISGVDGQQRAIEYSATMNISPGQHLLVARDVTERQQRRAELERYGTVLDSVNDAAWVYDDDKVITFTNGANSGGLRIPRDRFVGTLLAATERYFTDPEAFDAWEALVEDVLAGVTAEGELDATLELGSEARVVNLRASPVPSDEGPTGVAVIASDITERKKREHALAEYETIVEALSDPVYVIDEEGRFTHVNDEFVELVGYDRATIIGNTPALFKSEAAVEQAESQLGDLLSSDGPEKVCFEVEILPRDGDPRICEDHMGVLPYEGDEFNGSVGTLRDATERRTEPRTD
jgi:PAS domain S-box-containing protein